MTEKTILISVVMSCYNSVSFVAEAMKSVTIQSYDNWELIIVDDFSTDESVGVIKKWIRKLNIESKVKLIRHNKNKGCGKSLRDAIDNSVGELIAVLDSDDTLSTNKALTKMVKFHRKNPDASLVYSNYTICNGSMKPIKIKKTRQMKKGESYLKGSVKISHFKVFKKEFYDKTEGVDITLRQTVDKDLILKLEEVGRLVHLDLNLYNYRNHRKNLTSSTRRKPKEYRKFISKSRSRVFRDAKNRRINKKEDYK